MKYKCTREIQNLWMLILRYIQLQIMHYINNKPICSGSVCDIFIFSYTVIINLNEYIYTFFLYTQIHDVTSHLDQ